MFDHLFTPITIKGMTLRNRVILPAMGTRMANEKSEVTQRLIDYHEARAKGGCGLNIVEVSSVHTPSAPAHFVSLSEDHFIEGHKRLTDAIHSAGGKAAVQLWQGSIAVSFDPNARKFVVNDMPMGPVTLPAITLEEIEEIISCYGKAAKRAVEAGYDCIEFHCAHNYLPHSFLSGGINHRQDEYGGSLENRARFPLACIRAIRENIPEDMPLFMRIDAQDDCLPNGLTIEEIISFCKMAQQEGVDVLDVSRGNIITAATVYEVPPIDVPRGFNVDNAARIRKETGMLTVAVGRINTAAMAEEILTSDKADMVVMGRAQLADPDFCNKAMSGNVEDIVHCIGCNQGCYDGFCDVMNRPFITCLRNPALGHEKEYALTNTDNTKKVMIIGGGMAGLETAKVLKLRGHQPEIYEASDHLGGQFITAGQAPGKQEMKEAAVSFGKQVMKMGVPVHFETKVTPELIKEKHPDVVIFATGAEPIDLPLPGKELKPVVSAHAVLDGRSKVEGRVCVIGGGLVGLEVADYLANQKHEVTVIEMLDEAGKDLGTLRKICVMTKMQMLHVQIMTNTKSEAVSEEGLVCHNAEGAITIPCDSIVMAVGARSRNIDELKSACDACAIPYEVIGDAQKARRALNAVEEGFMAARKI